MHKERNITFPELLQRIALYSRKSPMKQRLCLFELQSWPFHHSEWKSYNKYVLFNTFIMSQTIYC